MNPKNIKIETPPAVQEILKRLQSHGYEAYIVGGCVRDALLGREPEDWDITTSALPLEVKALFPNSTVDTGIQHGTVMVIKGGVGYEVTTYRVDGEYKDGRHPSNVTFTRSLTEDLKRRDFTINAFAWDENGLIDCFNGIQDLQDKVIRCVGNPDERFNEDALRIMRAVRFSAQLGFVIETQTRAMISKYAARLADISMERIRVEFEKTLLSKNPFAVEEYAQLGLGGYIIRDYADKCFRPESADLYREILKEKAADPDAATKKAELYRRLLMAAFFVQLTAEETDKAFRYLKYDNKTREAVTDMIRYQKTAIEMDRVAVKLLLNKVGLETFLELLEFQNVLAACGQGISELSQLKRIRELTDEILESGEAWNIAQLEVNGADLIAAGVPKGKKIGEFLEKILHKVIKNPTLNHKEKLLNSVFLSEVENECSRGI